MASAVSAADIAQIGLDEVKRRFLSLFPRRTESIWKKPEHKRWFTQHSFALSDQQILNAVDGKSKRFLGARFGSQTQFAVIDIDTNSPYYNVLSLIRLRRALELVGLNETHVYQSSASKGWHLWIFFDTWVNADEVNKLLAAWLKKQQFAIGSGILEIFPSANGLRLPLQPGFAWLSDNQSREEITLEQALRRFICDSMQANEWRTAADSIANELAAGRVIRPKKERHSGLIPERWNLGKHLWRTGLQQPGQRHNAILAVEHYLWYGDQDAGIEALPGYHNNNARETLILDWLERKHNGMCKHINRGDWRTVTGDVHRACAWRTSANIHTPYAHTDRKVDRMMEARGLTPSRFITGNLARENYAGRRIARAYAELSSGGRKPSINEVATKAGSHWNTVRKHWNLLTRSSGDQSPGIDLDRNVLVLPDPAPVPVAALENTSAASSSSSAEKPLSESSEAYVAQFPSVLGFALNHKETSLHSFSCQDFSRNAALLSSRAQQTDGAMTSSHAFESAQGNELFPTEPSGKALLDAIRGERFRTEQGYPEASQQLIAQGVLPDASGLLNLLASAQTDYNGIQLAHNSLDDAWLKRHEQRQANYHNDWAQQLKDAAYTPREGQTWPVRDFFASAQSPVSEAYALSTHLPAGQLAKSQTLENTVERLMEVPWDVKINVISENHSDYSNADSLIHLNPKRAAETQIEEFAHEAYHATHQFLNKLWGGDRVDKQTFVTTWVWGEVNAMLHELKVRKDLNIKEPVEYSFIDASGNSHTEDVGKCIEAHGEKGLFGLLYSAQPMNRNEKPYGKHYADAYDAYSQNFESDSKSARALINQWVKSGHEPNDI